MGTRLTPETIQIGMGVKLKNGRNTGVVIALNKWHNIATCYWSNGATVDLDTDSLYTR